MRITNTMITNNTKANINSNKLLVDKYNTQMTTQKKIAKASENPVIAIRSLRLSTTMSHINQYVDNNIPDANAPFRLMKREVVEKYIGKMPVDFNLPNVMFTTYFSYFNEKLKNGDIVLNNDDIVEYGTTINLGK